MNQIRPYPLWIGHAGDGRDNKTLLKIGIQAVMQLAVDEPPLQLSRELIYCRFPLVDAAGNDPNLLTLAITTLVAFLQANVPTLLCCSAGMSRSPALAAAALSLVQLPSPEECLEQIARQHPTDVSLVFWNEVRGMIPVK
jgi:protein-tyrosine phosphatase